MVEVRFKPADVGTVADGSVTEVKLANGAVTDVKVASGIAQSKITNLATDLAGKASTADLANKVSTGPLSGDKKVTAIGWDSASGEVVIDHEA